MNILGFQKTTLLDYPHQIASTIFLGGCNFRCPYCHNKNLVLLNEQTTPFSKEEILAHLKKRSKTLDGVCITGGEATLTDDLYAFIKEIKALDLLVKLDTNGTNSIVLNKLIEDNLIDYVAMDIKQCLKKYPSIAWSSTLSSNNANSYNLNDYQINCLENVKESVRLLKTSSIDYEFRTTICPELFCENDFDEIGQWLKGCKDYFLQPYKETENVINPIFTTPSKDTLLNYISILNKYDINAYIRGEAL